MTQSALPRIASQTPALLRHVTKLVEIIAIAGKVTTDPPLNAENERLELLRHCTHEGLWDWDMRSDQVHYFPRFRELLGYDAEEALSRSQLAFHPDDSGRMRRAIRRLFDQRIPIDEEFRLRCKNGDYRWFRGRGHAVWDEQGKPLRFAGSIADISEYKENELRLLHLADHDTLTKLPNRRLFLERLSQAIERARGLGGSLAVLLVDLDRFKQINNVVGHEAGNQVLCEAAMRIGRSVREDDIVSRLGGDEFAVLLERIEAATPVSAVADRIRTELNRPFPGKIKN